LALSLSLAVAHGRRKRGAQLHHHSRSQIAILIRFSYPARNGFKAGGGDGDAARLYDPVRLDRRFAMFQALTLPSLLAQTDPDFTCIFLIGQAMPEAARDRLAALVAPLRHAVIHAEPPRFHYPATQLAFDAGLDPDAQRLVSVRLDDDDALALDYVAALRAVLPGVHGLTGDTAACIAFNRGLFAELGGGPVYGVCEKFPLGIGLAMTATAASRENIFARNHRLLPQFFNLWSDASTPMFIRTIHPDNDSEPYVSGRREDMDDSQIDALLRARFGTTLAALRAIHP
jgi:hypothetical protein